MVFLEVFEKMVNHGSLICSNLNPNCVDLSQLHRLRHLRHLSHLRHLRHVIYVSVFKFTSPLRVDIFVYDLVLLVTI
jgi:hypothetical protein